MKRRILAFVFAVMLTAALVLNVSAKTVKYVEVAGVEYYCAVTCYASSAYGTTQTMDDSVTVGVTVELCDSYGNILASGNLNHETCSADVTVQYKTTIDHADAKHKANGSQFATTTEDAP